MGAVWLGRDRRDDSRVAVKLLHPHLGGDPEFRGRFEREAHVAALLRSPYTVHLIDFGVTEGTCYLVMEFIEGHSVGDELKHGPIEPARALRIATEIARALEEAGARGVAHRDIKPDNFFVVGGALSPGATIKVLDFGIAKVMQSQAATALATTGTQITSFTPNYGAPEQFDRRHGATGPWTDVFGMALVFIEMMRGGLPPLDGETFMQLAFASQNPNERPTPRGRGLDVSVAVEEVFETALAITVTERFKNMGAFWTALAGALGISDYPAMPTVDKAIAHTSTGAHPSLTNSKVTPQLGTTLPIGGAGSARTGVTQLAATEEGPAPARAGGSLPLLVAGGLGLVALLGVAAFFLFTGPPKPEVTDPPDEPSTPDAPPEVPVVAPPDVGAAATETCPEGMRSVSGGKFFMGSDNTERAALLMARPAHQVEVAPYCLDVDEVTVADYQACSERGECKRAFKDSYWPKPGGAKKADWTHQREVFSALCNEGVEGRGDHPINCVTWAQAQHYCDVHGKRLPTEAEWEFAARGSDGRVFPWGDEPPTAKHANVCGAECLRWREEQKLEPVEPLHPGDDGHVGTAPIGSFPQGRTQHELDDMIGNVFEWTADNFAPFPGAPEQLGAMDFAGKRVIRGGAFNSSEPAHADPALRYPQDESTHTHAIGFRCAATPEG
ncbi:MAG: SUMF1/EgtB/PvdO family nonheme iron enzyme [Myxococcales bacterium]|nr:SUMF1/EgtB/PvdO family nonheme iron enzyme [Myxococcales bacterium]